MLYLAILCAVAVAIAYSGWKLDTWLCAPRKDKEAQR